MKKASAILCLKTIPLIILATILAKADAAAQQDVRFANETADTARITGLLVEECRQEKPGNVERIARRFIGTPYAAGTLEHSPEMLTVNIDSMDCTTFVETVLALAYTAAEGRQSWRDFTYNLQRLRYRQGEVDGYASRLHYPSAWIVDNTARGNLKEVTDDVAGARHVVKSLDYMSAHRNDYPALADSTNYAAVRNMEAGFSNHRYPVVKAPQVKASSILPAGRPGDVVLFTTSTRGLDVTHMGILTYDGKEFHFIHASRKAGKVVEEPLTLSEYVRRNRNEGIRLVRLTP